MYDEMMKWAVVVMATIAFCGGLLAIIQYLRKPYRKEIKEVDDRRNAEVKFLSESFSKINADDWSRMQKIDTRLTASVNDISVRLGNLIDTRITLVSCDECGCMVDARRAKDGKDEVREEVGLTANNDLCLNKKIYTPHYCKRCAAELDKKVPLKAKVGK